MRNVFAKYGVNLSVRELVLVNAAHAAGMSDAYNRYHDALENRDPSEVQSLSDDVWDAVNNAKQELERFQPGVPRPTRLVYAIHR